MSWTPRSSGRMADYDKSKHPLRTIIETAVARVPAVRRSHVFRAHAHTVANDVADVVIDALTPNLPLCDVAEDIDRVVGVLINQDCSRELVLRYGTAWATKIDSIRERLKIATHTAPAVTEDMVQAAARALALKHGYHWDIRGYRYRGSDPEGGEHMPPDAWEDEARDALTAALTVRFDISKRRRA